MRRLVTIFIREASKFGVVGAVAFVIDVGGFNLLLGTVMPGKVTTAKIISGVASTLVAWLGNRYWTFRHRRSRPAHHELFMFFGINAIAIAIGAAWLAFTHYVLDWSSPLALNLNNLVGIGIGTIFRFWAYRRWVFAGERPGDPEPAAPEPTAPEPTAPEPTVVPDDPRH